jgi:hypothetical protein
MNYGSRVKANIAGLPKGYETMPFGRQIEYNNIIKDFKDTAKTGYLGTKRKSVSAALAEFKKLYGVKEYYFIDTTAPGYKDDSIKIWYKTAMQANPAKPPITRQWKPVLIRTNSAGQVQITPQATVRVKAKAVQTAAGGKMRNPSAADELVKIGKNGSGAENAYTQQLVNMGYARRHAGRVYLTDKGKQEYKQQAGRVNPKSASKPNLATLQKVASRYDVRVQKSRSKDYSYSAHGFLGDIQEFLRQIPVEFKQQGADGVYFTVKAGKANPKTWRRNPGDSGPLTPLDSILSAAGYSSRSGTTTRDASGEILRTEYRNGPGKSITVLSDRRGMGKPSYSWISNGPILPAHSGVRTKQTVATLKRTLKAHLKKMDKR